VPALASIRREPQSGKVSACRLCGVAWAFMGDPFQA
jgi:hypothetical protein